MKFEMYQDKAGEWRWRFKAGNGQIIATASESYKQKKSCEHSIELIKDSKKAPVEEV